VHRLKEHRCKHCGALLALIDERARYQRFALRCPECRVELVVYPPKPVVVYTVTQEVTV